MNRKEELHHVTLNFLTLFYFAHLLVAAITAIFYFLIIAETKSAKKNKKQFFSILFLLKEIVWGGSLALLYICFIFLSFTWKNNYCWVVLIVENLEKEAIYLHYFEHFSNLFVLFYFLKLNELFLVFKECSVQSQNHSLRYSLKVPKNWGIF